mgnify:CR=1 FL=1
MVSRSLAMEKNPTITVSDCGLVYDFEDFGMNVLELQEKYRDTGEHPEYTRDAYTFSKSEAYYWDWVIEGIAKDDEDC